MALTRRPDWASTLIARRGPVQLALLAIVALAALAIPSLETRFDPAELVAADASLQGDLERTRRLFGEERPGIVVLVDGRGGGVDLLSFEELARNHALARRLAALPDVAAVESLTTTALPMREAGDEGAGTLDDLEEEAESDGALELLTTIVGADAERFPLGMLSAEQGAVVVRPFGRGATLQRDEGAAAARAQREVPLLRRRLASEDGRVAVLVVMPTEGLEVGREAALLDRVRAELAASGERDGVELAVTGIVAMRVEMIGALRADQWRLVVLATLGALVVLVLGMRSLAGVVLPLATVGLSLSLALGLMVATGTPLNLLTNMLPPLLLTIGLAEAMHMVVRYRDERALGLDALDAAAETLRSMWLACFVTTFTTAVGFGALVLQESEGLRRFGLIAAVASMLTYVVTVLFVPAWLPSFEPRGGARAPTAGRTGPLDEGLLAVGRAMARRPWAAIAISAVLTVGSAWVARGLVVESRLLDQFARSSEVARSSLVLEQELDGFRGFELVLEGPPGLFATVRGMDVLDAVAGRARAHEEVLRVTTAADWARDANGRLGGEPSADRRRFASDAQVAALLGLVAHGNEPALRRYVTADASAARVEIRLRDHGATRTLALVEELEQAARAETPGLEAWPAGEAFVSSRGLERIVGSLGSLAAAVVTIFVVMALLFRSVRLGLLAIPPNALPLLLTLAYMVWRGIALHAATVIVFTVTVGLAVDGTTHVVARYREELERGGTREEVLLRTVAGSGRPVLLSSLTLIVGYLVLLASTFEPVRLFGELSAVAIAASTVSQTFLLPALLAVAAPRPPAPPAAQSESRPSSDEVNAPSSGK